MQKTALLVVCLLTGFVPDALPFSAGPPANRNGLSGVYCTACHRTFELNEAGGSIAVTGLPAAWLPGATYRLRVTISRPGAIRFGFQLTAVDSTGQSAGTFATGADGRTQLVTGPVNGFPVVHVEHTSVGSTIGSGNTFEFDWTAPATAATGSVRFHVAGNAANGNGANTGDYIYAIEVSVGPAATSRSFAITDRGASTSISSGSGNLVIGHTRITPASGSTAPSGLAIFGYGVNGILASEVGIPAVAATSGGRFYVEVGGGVNTGVALANPGNAAASVSFFFTDAGGNNFSQGTLTVPANGQVSGFLDQPTFYTPSAFTPAISTARAFSYSSTVPIAVTALRGLTNERNEFLMTSLPVTDLSATPSSQTAYLPHFADGGGWQTGVVLVNPTNQAISGTVSFYGTGSTTLAATPLTMTVSGQSGTSFNYTVQARSSVKLTTAGTGTATVGSVRVTPSSGNTTPDALSIFSLRRNNMTVSEAGAAPSRVGSAFRMFVETSGNFQAGEAMSAQSGIAITNTTANPATVTFELSNLDGSSLGMTGSAVIPAQGQTARFIGEIAGFAALPAAFQGLLRVSSTQPVSVTGIRGRYNNRPGGSDFRTTTTPASMESAAAGTAETVFPHIVDGGGYTTQFVVFSGSAGQSSSGSLRFFAQDGQPIAINVR